MSVLQIHRVSKTFSRGERAAVRDVSLPVEEGSFTALVGESGSGKTTLLRMVAGLETPDAGEIRIADRVVCNGRTLVPPEERGVGLVFQSHALFPHLTVKENLAFGLGKKVSRGERKRIIGEMLELIGLPGHGGRYPHELSGGERQRVALARALARRPSVVLLDEPFSNLDASLRARVRDELREILRRAGATALFVTHHTRDALSVADRVAVLRQGELQQVGTPREIYLAPANRYVARFFGPCNFLPGDVFGATEVENGDAREGERDRELWIRPENLEVRAAPEKKGTSQGIPGRVEKATFCGEHRELRVRCRLPGGKEVEVTVFQADGEERGEGDEVMVLPRRG